MPRISAGGLTSFYRDEGDPALPVLVLAHPVGADHGIWDAVVPKLSGHFRVVRYDLHGHGGTDVVDHQYTLQRLADDVLSLLGEIDVDEFSFCGISLGGLTGLEIAARGERRLQRLLVANTPTKLPLSHEQWNEIIAIARTKGTSASVDSMINRMFSESFREHASPSFHSAIRTYLCTSPIGYAAGLTALRDSDVHAKLGQITCKTKVVGSTEDLAVPRDSVARMAERIPDASLTTLAGGHFSALENPAGLAQAVFDLHGIRT
ncbi:alpha/beta fold hydrolase [Paraburkholderia phenoliruptrix]|nr:alpha/beta fold hydrolase [Paraburkholderia phenoliruptrix]CAB4048627.1 3-oxoadipate enol-lactonase 2 [Paraburkholderia phenoliruptrix]